MGILSWIILGLVAGALAKWIMPGRDPGGCFITILLGVAGAMLGGFVATFFGYGDVSGFNLYSFLIATGGALLLLFIYRMLKSDS
ncbi:MAG: GlsB/YeaQ/YmgE family stress response membrane protein [Gammaproteobacteria bacterium]